jgi:YD repeat-containing protein
MGLSGVIQSDSGLPRPRVPGHGSNPPPPIIGPTGNAKLDAVTDIVNRTFEPFRTAPDPARGVCGVIQHYVGGAMGIIGAPFEMLDTGFAMLTAPLANLMPAFPAATLLMPHLGPPHAHAHPPSLIPPAPPVPLPSIGMVMLPGCVSVLHGGVPAARAGDIGMAFTCGSIAPGLDVYTGSSNTFIGGSRAARIFDITRHCNPLSGASAFNKAMAGMGVALGVVGAGAQLTAGNSLGAAMAAAQAAADAAAMALRALLGKDPGVAPGYGVVMMGCPLVMIGGFPMPDLLEMLGALLKAISKGLSRLRDLQRRSRFWQRLSNNSRRRASAAMRRLGVPRSIRRAISSALCFATGHPVDVVTGTVFTSMVDLRVAGPMPLVFERDWYAGEDYRGSLGHGWHHSFDLALCEEAGGVAVRLADGRGVSFLSLAPGKSQYDRKERLTLLRTSTVGYMLRSADGKRYYFGEPIEGRVMPLQCVANPVGQKIYLGYDARGRLSTIIDTARRRFVLQYGPRDEDNDIIAIYGPHPDDPARSVKFVGYHYSPAGDLVAVEDALGHVTRYEYAGHLLVSETDRNGLSFRFEYAAGPQGPRCVRTWGDQNIYDHRLAYDDDAKTTTVTNSLGHPTVYQRGDNGLATTVIDPLGGRRSHTYNAFAQPILSVDELGAMVYREYDWRGNLSKIVDVDGAIMQMAYDEQDRLCRATDPNGCWIQWDYDEQGRTIRRNGGDGARREFKYAGQYLIGTRDATGNQFELGYDAHGNISDILGPTGTRARWRFDNLGRPVDITDPTGKVERRRYDLRGRLVEQVQVDGNHLSYGYDAVGRNTRVTQGKREILLGYTGTGRLAWRREQDTTLRFEYDTEDQLMAVFNQAGEAWRFERWCAPNVWARRGRAHGRASPGVGQGHQSSARRCRADASGRAPRRQPRALCLPRRRPAARGPQRQLCRSVRTRRPRSGRVRVAGTALGRRRSRPCRSAGPRAILVGSRRPRRP